MALNSKNISLKKNALQNGMRGYIMNTLRKKIKQNIKEYRRDVELLQQYTGKTTVLISGKEAAENCIDAIDRLLKK